MSKKIILITGASSGMGKITAESLAHQGHIVYGAARRVEPMKSLVSKGGKALSLDITKEESVVSAVSQVIREQGRIDVLINNAGFGLYGAVEDTTIDDARYQLEVNLLGLGRLTQLVLPYMRQQKAGTIINISSMGGKIYTHLGAWYHATKHALEGWSDCLRLETKDFGINVVVVEPGIINTDFGNVMTDPMLKRTENTAYGPLAKRVAKATSESYKPGGGSDPMVIANTISKIIKSSRPKTRYAVGKFAKILIFVRKWFGDKIYDKAVMSQV